MIAQNCIHLHACRRIARLYKDAGREYVPRHCDDECPCYQTFETPLDAQFLGVVDIKQGCLVNGLCCDDRNGLERVLQ